MAVTSVGRSTAAALSAPRLGDVFAGVVSGLLSVAYGLSFAALIFSGQLAPWLAFGIVATFLTSAISAAIVAARSSLPFVIAGPDGATAAVTATLAAVLAARLTGDGGAANLGGPVLVLMALSAVLTGILLWTIGIARAGGAIRFVPYPVIGGFLGATGWLMVSGAARVITDQELSLVTFGSLAEPAVLLKFAAAAAIAVALFFALRTRTQSPYALPGVLLAGLAATYLVMALGGMSFAEAQAAGWTFTPPAPAGLFLLWGAEDLRVFPWHTLPALAGDLFAVMFVTTITMLLNTTGIELATRREADLERELKAVGMANLISGAFGGYVSCTSLSRTCINYAAGGRGRLCGFIVAAICLAMLAVGTGFLAYVPKFLLAGLLLFLGVSLMWQWLVESVRRLSLLEYASLLTIAMLIIQVGFLAGVLIGVLIGCVTFAVSASWVSAMKFSFDGSEYRSSLDRSPEELTLLASHGSEIQGMSLQSYLFFGSANRLYRRVKELLAKHPETRFLIFDFRLVTGLDSSALHSFAQIKRVAEETGARLVLVNLTPGLGSAFRNPQFITQDVVLFSDLDHALEFCEEAVIAAHSEKGGGTQDLVTWFTEALGSAELAEQLASVCERLAVRKGEIVASQGDPPDSMHFILSGRVGIMVRLEDGRLIRVRSLGPHTTIGEMGLITGQSRSATIQAETESVLYALSRAAFERIQRENQSLSQALLTYVIKVMSERLSFASKTIGVLHR